MKWLLILLLTVSALAESAVSVYYDTREVPVVNFTHQSVLPAGLELYGYTDFKGQNIRKDDRFDLRDYFLEYRLSRQVVGNLYVQGEYNDTRSSFNSLGRLGVAFRQDIDGRFQNGGFLEWRFFPITTGDGTHFSLVGKYEISRFFTVSGFLDYDVLFRNDQGQRLDRWFTEIELDYFLGDNLFLLWEYRFNEREAKRSGMAFGLRVGL